jgi:hypothetical protein
LKLRLTKCSRVFPAQPTGEKKLIDFIHCSRTPFFQCIFCIHHTVFVEKKKLNFGIGFGFSIFLPNTRKLDTVAQISFN